MLPATIKAVIETGNEFNKSVFFHLSTLYSIVKVYVIGYKLCF